jgi:hypothetical protein
MIHKTDNGVYVISSYHLWLPGVYEDRRTANYAFRFKNEQLQKLQDEKNKTSGVITFKDLRKLKKQINEIN